MTTELRVLSMADCELVHERSLHVLSRTGIRVDTAVGRSVLREAGAAVDEDGRRVRFPADLVQRSLSLAPSRFTLGGRRPGWSHALGAGAITLVADGGGNAVLDRRTGQRRAAAFDDWREATRVCDALDDIGVYWWMVESGLQTGTPAGMVAYLTHVFGEFGKHVQDSFDTPETAPWLLRALEIVFGGADAVRRRHPISFLLTPASPLIIDERYTETWLALRGYDIPVAVMPMPLMGATAPAGRLATLLQANCEVLGALCLVQAAAPGTPFISAAAPALMDPRSGRYAGGAIEQYVLSAAAVEMARFYGLPVEASGCGTDAFEPSPQAAYEKGMSVLLATLARPDLLVGPGMLGGATVLSFEQLVMDVEMARMARAVGEGLVAAGDRLLEEVIDAVGPGGSFLAEPSTRRARGGDEWPPCRFGAHQSHAAWRQAGAPSTVEQARAEVERLLGAHRPEPLPDDVAAALRSLLADARRS